MKLSSIRTDKNGQQYLKNYEFGAFLERIKTDTANFLIGFLRDETPPEAPTRYRHYRDIPHICAPMELRRQQNGALGMSTFNGLVVLEVRQVMSPGACETVKHAAMEMPMTLAAFVGASGHEVIILVRVARNDGTLPTSEVEAEPFYVQAYQRIVQVYDPALPQRITRMTPSPRHSFLLPLDEAPLTNPDAVPYRINTTRETVVDAHPDDHLLALPERRDAQEVDMTAYENYERAYRDAAQRVATHLHNPKRRGPEWFKAFVTGMATELYRAAWPEEEAVCHLWRHLTFKDEPGLTEDFVRRIVEAVYEEEQTTRHRQDLAEETEEPVMQQIIRRMESRYVFRHNTIMGYTEYRANHTWVTPWQPVTRQVINTFTTDLLLAGLKLTNHHVQYYVNSTRIRAFNPIEDYLFRTGEWDGRDHIRALAATVPTRNKTQWANWFHTWFLAMVAQWQGRDRRYGNAIVPLLISEQGMHKSAFCRLLLPPELRSWGYTDNLSLSEERPVHLAMSQMLIINLDEFNRISPQKQQGFLKNILQLPSVKVKRPYATRTEEVPRLASFIATTNMSDVLHDPTGSRRFLGVEVTGNIDVSQTPNYAQLYAQAQAELNDGARYWFDDDETRAIMEHNRQFQQHTTAEQFFHEFFEAALPEEPTAKWMTVAAILMSIKEQAGASFRTPSPNAFGRTLNGLPELLHRRSKNGSEYCVKPRF
ncbi:MAG: DUF3874 domain-containing protein [Bacteroidaceae bacterium]|nr:DUF3874 domain-containing protein [Bacteroidaceae bacterium]